jgi:hypothetical protein
MRVGATRPARWRDEKCDEAGIQSPAALDQADLVPGASLVLIHLDRCSRASARARRLQWNSKARRQGRAGEFLCPFAFGEITVKPAAREGEAGRAIFTILELLRLLQNSSFFVDAHRIRKDVRREPIDRKGASSVG